MPYKANNPCCQPNDTIRWNKWCDTQLQLNLSRFSSELDSKRLERLKFLCTEIAKFFAIKSSVKARRNCLCPHTIRSTRAVFLLLVNYYLVRAVVKWAGLQWHNSQNKTQIIFKFAGCMEICFHFCRVKQKWILLYFMLNNFNC